ncbi:hypothetical protein J6590_077382 [Homalodisca vitripennis]|nr:hypothetical protein J6590_077382 [Homalodisca vitripennis]
MIEDLNLRYLKSKAPTAIGPDYPDTVGSWGHCADVSWANVRPGRGGRSLRRGRSGPGRTDRNQNPKS